MRVPKDIFPLGKMGGRGGGGTVDCSPPPSAKVKNDELLVVAFMVCRERERDLYIQSITETNKFCYSCTVGRLCRL